MIKISITQERVPIMDKNDGVRGLLWPHVVPGTRRFENYDFHDIYRELCIFSSSSMLDDVCEEEDVLEPIILVIRWNNSLEIRMHH